MIASRLQVSLLKFTSLLFPCSRFIFNTQNTTRQYKRRMGRRRYAKSQVAALG